MRPKNDKESVCLKKNFSDKRKHKRLKAAYLVKYETGYAGEAPRITNIRDISAGGMRFLTKDILSESAVIKLKVMAPPAGRVFDASARILRVRRANRNFVYSVAVNFVNISAKDREDLEIFIEDMARHEDTRICIDQAQVVLKQGKARG